jgi:hypothetical protein
MGDRTELAITLFVTGLSTYVGYETGGLVGAEISNVASTFVGSLFAMRKNNLITVTEDAADRAGLDGDDLVAWIKADDRHFRLFAEVLEAAWSTVDRHKLRMLARVMADGFQDDARLDVDQLVVRALRELESAHLRVLDEAAQVIEEQGDNPNALRGVSLQTLRNRLPNLSEGMNALVAGLQRTGCLAEVEYINVELFGNVPLAVTAFGLRCLEIIRAEAEGDLQED